MPAGLLAALLFLALAGNFAEEVLFRGLLQGRLERTAGPVRAAALSALLFAACHVFLATTVTDVGLPLLAFTLYEGAVCALVRMRRGVCSRGPDHGLGIFLIASGVLYDATGGGCGPAPPASGVTPRAAAAPASAFRPFAPPPARVRRP